MQYNPGMAEKNRSKKRYSMQDVADLAGVSRTTVSFVINETPNSNIPQETKEKVWAAVKELGYRPNVIAQGLRSQTTQTIGFISDEIATTPYAGRMIQGAQDLAWEHNKLLLLVNSGDNSIIVTGLGEHHIHQGDVDLWDITDDYKIDVVRRSA